MDLGEAMSKALFMELPRALPLPDLQSFSGWAAVLA